LPLLSSDGTAEVAPATQPDWDTYLPERRSFVTLREGVRRAADLRWALVALLLGLPLPIVILIRPFVGR